MLLALCGCFEDWLSLLQLSPLSLDQNSFFFQKEIKDHLSQLGRALGKTLNVPREFSQVVL